MFQWIDSSMSKPLVVINVDNIILPYTAKLVHVYTTSRQVINKKATSDINDMLNIYNSHKYNSYLFN